MTRKKPFTFLLLLNAFLMIVSLGVRAEYAHALELGKTYDRNNWQEIQELLIPPVQNWVKKGQFTIPTGKLNFQLALDPKYQEASRKNQGKYDISSDGLIVMKDTGKLAGFIYGNPFPVINPKDPKVGAKILENYKFTVHYRMGSSIATGYINWVGKNGLEREIVAAEALLFYKNRPRGPIPNPNNFLQQMIQWVKEPFDLKGTVQMAWTYNSQKPDTAFAYVPMLRRVRRVSAAARSDPFVGSDVTVDDSYGWGGKNAAFTFKLIGEGTFLVPFVSPDKFPLNKLPDGSMQRTYKDVKQGYQVQGWTGAPWAPVDVVWHPRPLWIVEGVAKDPYYNYGKFHFYIDKENYCLYFRPMYNRAGEYWKTLLYAVKYSETKDGDIYIGISNLYLVVDDKAQHATVAEVRIFPGQPDRMNMPVEEFGPRFFTESNLRELSK